jgi:hypothetical protein
LFIFIVVAVELKLVSLPTKSNAVESHHTFPMSFIERESSQSL